ncbi:hypothetical protein [Powai lake megavirus]|uniref:Uncharacterized protein n=1 Tax=Powai lake megavirus TaxID=1842663 RepID=A0A167RID1_9VIRU|nr:hypothetical protein QJ849_gp558 [Powai lake megavirus]ANB50720.1 hypothetical protein [Powai lake megavirus]
MSYKNQMLKQVTNGKCDRRTYFNMINKKAHPRGRNQNDKSSDSITDLIMGKKTFDDYNKDSDINDNENENEKNQLDSLSQNNSNNDDNDVNNNDDNDDNNNDNNNNNNNNDETSTISHARKPNTSNKSIITVNMPSRLRKPISNRGSLHTMQNNNNNENNKLLNKIDILEAKIIKLEAKIKILNLQMNSILENHS